MKRKGLRQNIVEGLFYPASREQLEGMLEPLSPRGQERFALFPHADWQLIFPLFEAGWPHLNPQADRILLISSVHREMTRGIFLPLQREFQSPLGPIPLDTRGKKQLGENCSLFVVDGKPHEEEHSLEILLPLISFSYPGVPVLPLLTGELTEAEIGEAAEALYQWANDKGEVLILCTANGDLEHPDEGEPFCGTLPLALLRASGLLPENLTHRKTLKEEFRSRHYRYPCWGG